MADNAKFGQTGPPIETPPELTPPTKHSAPGSPFMRNAGGKAANSTEKRPNQIGFGATIGDVVAHDVELTAPTEGYGMIANGAGQPNDAATKGTEHAPAHVQTFGEDAPQDSSFEVPATSDIQRTP